MMNRNDLIERFAAAVLRDELSVATAESLTSGLVASTLGSAKDASVWFRGGIIAYRDDVKFELLGVTPGPVVSADCAREMAQGVRSLLDSDVSISTT
jgi:nicotinamide-nucleotide amidase